MRKSQSSGNNNHVKAELLRILFPNGGNYVWTFLVVMEIDDLNVHDFAKQRNKVSSINYVTVDVLERLAGKLPFEGKAQIMLQVKKSYFDFDFIWFDSICFIY